MKYAFYLSTTPNELGQKVEPHWTDSVQMEWRRESGSGDLRKRLPGPFRFVKRQGYEIIDGAGIEAEFILTIKRVLLNGDEVDFFVATFGYQNCSFDYEQANVSVRLEPNDDQRRMLDNINTEYDFIREGARPVACEFTEFVILQLYVVGSGHVTNIQPGYSWTQPVSDSDFSLTFSGLFSGHFATDRFSLAYIPPVPGLTEDVSGSYFRLTALSDIPAYLSENNAYQIFVEQISGDVWRWYIQRLSDGQRIFQGEQYEPTDLVLRPNGGIPDLVYLSDSSQVVRLIGIEATGRILTNQDSFEGQATQDIEGGDLFIGSLSYTKAAPFSIFPVVASVESSDLDQGYGRYSTDGQGDHAGKFVARPQSFPDELVFPVAQSRWTDAAFWFSIFPPTAALFPLPEKRIIEDCYLLSDIIDIVVNLASDGQVRHPRLPSTSRLMYGATDPYTGEEPEVLVVIPKSNIIVRGYDNAASKGPIRLRSIVDMLYAIRDAKWAVEDGVLVFETFDYFQRGGSYDSDQVGVSLLDAVDPRNGLPIEYDQKKVDFDFGDIKERIKFAQQENVSDAFSGQDIVITSRYAQGTGEETRTASEFTFDLTFSLAQIDNISEQGYFVLACRYDQSKRRYVILERQVPGFYSTQNGSLSFPYIQETYFRSVLPGGRVQMNGSEISPDRVRRVKQQRIVSNLGANFNPRLLIPTSQGNGKVDSATYRLDSGRTEVNLKHEP